MTEMSRERRAELREDCDLRAKPHSGSKIVSLPADELRTLLDYADERDEAVALLRQTVFIVDGTEIDIPSMVTIRHRIDALLRRVGGG